MGDKNLKADSQKAQRVTENVIDFIALDDKLLVLILLPFIA